ncbi:MAG: collagen-like protein [Bacteroidales bacterium]|nr:collagen-like protein [Bacteroidales bacterium]
MNKIYTSIARLGTASMLLFLVSALTVLGQTPTTFNYQAVLRDATGHIHVSTNVSIQLVIHQGTSTGTTVYSEIHNATTTEFGLVNLEIGSVTPASFATINWAAGPYFVEVIVNGTTMGVSELLTVPYALYAVNGVPGPQGEQGEQGIQGIQGEPGLPGVIEANSVGSSHVIDNSLTVDDLDAGSVGSSEVVDNSLTADDLAEGSVGSSEVVDNSLAATDIAPDAIGASELANNSVASANVIDNTLTASDLATNSVGVSEIATNAVGAAEIAAGAVGSSEVADGSLTSLDLLNEPGVEFINDSDFSVWNAGELDTRSLGSITMSIPSSGYVLLTHTGYIRFYTQSRFLIVGIGENATTMLGRDLWVGYLAGTNTNDVYIPYTVTVVVAVTAGNRTFHALGRGFSGYTTGSAFMAMTNLVGVFIPTRY